MSIFLSRKGFTFYLPTSIPLRSCATLLWPLLWCQKCAQLPHGPQGSDVSTPNISAWMHQTGLCMGTASGRKRAKTHTALQLPIPARLRPAGLQCWALTVLMCPSPPPGLPLQEDTLSFSLPGQRASLKTLKEKDLQSCCRKQQEG